MPDTVIKKGAYVKYAIISENVTVGRNVKVGDEAEYYSDSDWGIAVIGKGNIIPDNTVITPNQII